MTARLPIRLRLTLAFTLVMTVVLSGTGLFLYFRLGNVLDAAIDQGLRARANDVTALVQQADAGLRQARNLRQPEGSFAQVIGPQGRVVDATAGLDAGTLLDGRQLRAARLRSRIFSSQFDGEHVRLLAEPVAAQDRKLVIVVGTSLEQRAEALAGLRRELLIGGPAALLLASFAGYLLAAAALRPVERMSGQAATISGANPGRRLSLPRADDEVSRLGTRLNEMLGRLESALDRERALVANASHELRTPLALMKTEIELALAEPESAPTLAAALRSAGEETDRLSQLTDDLLLLARADAGQLALRRSRVSVDDLLAAIAERYRRRAADTGRRIEVSEQTDLAVVADGHLLEQALSNLVENALRYGSGDVRIDAATTDDQLHLRVSDEGKGFPSSFLEHAFDRFSRADRSGQGGSGLGLSIVAMIAAAHGGTASARNDPEGGAAVMIVIPV